MRFLIYPFLSQLSLREVLFVDMSVCVRLRVSLFRAMLIYVLERLLICLLCL